MSPSLIRNTGLTLVLSSSLVASGSLLAAGFQISEQSIPGLGQGFAGNGVTGDLSGIFANPAGLALLSEGHHVQSGITFITASDELMNQGSSQTLLGAGGFTTMPTQGPDADGGTDSLVPNFYYAIAHSDKLRYGININAPFGLATEYNRNWVGRYHAVESALLTLDINPALSYRVNEHLSYGFGLSAQYADATLSQAVFTATPNDGFAELSGDNWAFGYNFGTVFEFGDKPGSRKRIGLSYRSKMVQDVDGEIVVSGTPGGANDGTFGAKATVELPETFYFSYYGEAGPKWSFTGTARHTRWKRFEELRIVFADGRPDTVTPENWRSTWTVGLGAAYQINSHWAAKVGYIFDQSPVRSPEFRTPRIPDSDRNWITLGGSYSPSAKLTIDFGYAHIFFSAANIDNTIDLVSTAPGAFTDNLRVRIDSADADLIGVGATLRF